MLSSALVEHESRLGGLLGLLVPGDLVVVVAVDCGSGDRPRRPAAAALHLTTHRSALERRARQLGHLSRSRVDHEYLRERNLEELPGTRASGPLPSIPRFPRATAGGRQRHSVLTSATKIFEAPACMLRRSGYSADRA